LNVVALPDNLLILFSLGKTVTARALDDLRDGVRVAVNATPISVALRAIDDSLSGRNGRE